ncbi:putative protein YeaO [Chlamydiales bacterium STE3]|nr:putative protein YeaO [Chlamydiales bacterium STE3]
MKIKIKRAYDPASEEDGIRILVDRLWPRGVKKTKLKLNVWLKDVAPSTALRKWFSHDPAKWVEFQQRYALELEENPKSWEPIMKALEHASITLIYGAHDSEHNHALCLKNYLVDKVTKKNND